MKEKIIGIDLGTTNSCVSIMESNQPKIIFNEDGDNTTPSIVAFCGTNESERLVGTAAKNQSLSNAENTFFGTKRLIGKKFDEVKQLKDILPYAITAASNGETLLKTKGGKSLTPMEIAAAILTKMKNIAEQYVGVPGSIKKAVVTVPAYFNDSQRQCTVDAGKIAGLEIVRIINEPTAAAFAYGVDKKTNGKIAVYDLGGGTFDISILELNDGVFEVLSTNGNTSLGGDDFDDAIIRFLLNEIKTQKNIDLNGNKTVLQRLKDAAEKAKKTLSNTMSTEIVLPFIHNDISFNYTMTRSKLENLVGDLVKKTIAPCESAIKDSGISLQDINSVILVGGMTRMPLVRETVKKIFGKEPETNINPDEAVAMGAALQGGVLAGDVTGVLLLDVTPLSLGIETLGGIMSILIPANSTIPTKKSQIFSTAADNQTAVSINVYQGNREIAANNKHLGEFNLDGIGAAPRGVPQIEVTFDMDANGILNVSAKDKGTGKEQKITIQHSSATSDAEIKRMQEEAERFAEEDKLKAELIEWKNKSDNLIYNTEKSLVDTKDIPEDLKSNLEEKLKDLKNALSNEPNSKEDIERAYNNLTESMGKLYEHQASQQKQENPVNSTENSTENNSES